MMRITLPLLASVLLAGCVASPAPEIDTSPPQLPDRFATLPDAAVATSLETLLPGDDPGFAELSALALAQAPTLGQAVARIEAARAGADRAGAERWPTIGFDNTVTASRTNPDQFGTNLPPGVAIDTERVQYGASVALAFDPDLFGRIRAQERAALARLDAANFEAASVRNNLLAEIAASVIDWRTLDARQRALEEDLAAADGLVRLAAVRERAGIAPGFDRVRAESTAEASRSRIAALGRERARLTGRLVTLTGLPAQRVLAALSQPAPPAAQLAAPASLPSDLLANRPDVRAAAAQLAAVDADLAATSARRFPQISLSAALGLLAFNPGDLFSEDALVGSASRSLLAPLLDFGRIQAEIDRAAAEKQAAFARYRDAVFTALGDAEYAYGLIAATDSELAAAEREAASASRAAELAETRYRAGLADFLTVLEARRAADASGERVATARGSAARARVLLWQSLGGVPDQQL